MALPLPLLLAPATVSSAVPLAAIDVALWSSVLLVLIGVVALGALYALVGRLRRVESELAGLAALDEILTTLRRLAESHGDLDLRRLEHVLIDIRDGQRRVEDGVLRVLESARADREHAAAGSAVVERPEVGLFERVVNRLLALGYGRVQLVTGNAELEAMAASDGEILVEARRDGASCKGRVLVRGGAITEVELKPAYTIFP